MDNGSQRMQNLEYLLQQSEAFEASSYKGVFNFVRYIEHMKKYKSGFAGTYLYAR